MKQCTKGSSGVQSQEKKNTLWQRIIDRYGRTFQMHIEHGSWHGPILDYYNMAFYVQNCKILPKPFQGE